MAASSVRRAFMLFHLALGLGILAATAQTAYHGLTEHQGLDLHLGMLVTLETLGALLFLLPKSIKAGGSVLLVVLLGGFVIHLTRGELAVQLLIYAAGVWFVMVHGPVWGAQSATPSVAA